jgi:hypothetical protein
METETNCAHHYCASRARRQRDGQTKRLKLGAEALLKVPVKIHTVHDVDKQQGTLLNFSFF